jgi:Rrf2 family transcriptional regulator, iron-sulfur cluster assembly transcription factor
MILSKACEYGVQALLFLDGQPPGQFVTVKEIAAGTNVSVSFLAKILGRLTAHGLLDSLKGPHGGVRLARPAEEIRVLEVVQAIDGLDFLRKCVIGFPRCGEGVPCPLHALWGPLREEIQVMLSAKSIGELMREMPARTRGLRSRRRAGVERRRKARR